MTRKVTESTIEETVLEWLGALGYSMLHGPDIEPEKPDAERENFTDVVLERRLRQAIARLNPELTADAVDEVKRAAGSGAENFYIII